MEIEIKLQVLPAVAGGPAAYFARLAALARLAGYPLGPVRPVALRDVYFDTPAGALAAWGAGLRLRVENGGRLVTLKVTRRQDGPLATREEYESPLTPETLEQVLAHARAQIGPEPVPFTDFAAGRPAGPLVPVLEVVTDRQARTVGRVATLTLDRVAYPGLAPEPFYDVEVEAATGFEDPAVLRALEADLTRLAWGHLLAATQSKLARGLLLRRG